jgi:hypothetical protein
MKPPNNTKKPQGKKKEKKDALKIISTLQSKHFVNWLRRSQ